MSTWWSPGRGDEDLYEMGVLKDGFDILAEHGVDSMCKSIAGWAKALTVAEWLAAPTAIEKFGNQDWIRLRSEDAEEAYRPGRDSEQGHRLYEAATDVLLEDLREKLLRGELMARAFREPFAPRAPYVTIARHEWRVLELKTPDRAEGAGVGYAGVTIGKVGTKRFFQWMWGRTPAWR
jgi:hypothetical protein